MGPGDLHIALCQLDLPTHPDLLVGLETADDAGVYRLRDDLAVIQTVDFFAPIVDDPFTFGRIAAANAFSDVYAMGGVPVSVLNIAGFPRKELPLEVLTEIFQGGLAAIREAGAVLAGGHTVEDTELKYGLSVMGTVHPDRIMTNTGARAGDRLVLTKPIGTGIIATALKGSVAGAEEVAAAERSMYTLNRAACEAMQEVGAHACTDITGFGLLGHAMEMAVGSGVGLKIQASSVPLFDGTLKYAGQGMMPGGVGTNKNYVQDRVEKDSAVEELLFDLLHDPQTSGGLLISLPGNKVDALLGALEKRGVETAAVIGTVISGGKGIRVTV